MARLCVRVTIELAGWRAFANKGNEQTAAARAEVCTRGDNLQEKARYPAVQASATGYGNTSSDQMQHAHSSRLTGSAPDDRAGPTRLETANSRRPCGDRRPPRLSRSAPGIHGRAWTAHQHARVAGTEDRRAAARSCSAAAPARGWKVYRRRCDQGPVRNARTQRGVVEVVDYSAESSRL